MPTAFRFRLAQLAAAALLSTGMAQAQNAPVAPTPTQVKPAVVSITTRLNAAPASFEDNDNDEQQMPTPFRRFPFGGMGPEVMIIRFESGCT